MKRALLIAFFSNDALIKEAYNEMQVELSQLGYAMEGIQPEGQVSSGYEFPAYSFGDSPARKHVSKISKACYLLPYFLPGRVEKSYAEMQSQGANGRRLLNCLHTLIQFRKHLTELIASKNIGFVILNHHFSGYHLIARDVCRREGIPFVFWHPGFLPGTMSFDREGQMAESEINAIIERELPACAAAEEELGKRYRKWCEEQSYARPGKNATSNISSVNELHEVRSRFKNVLLVIGSNDYRTGMMPRSYRNSHIHSKVVWSSSELYRMVAEHTDAETLVIYKPHPNLGAPIAGIQWDSVRSLRLFDITIRDLLPLVTASVTLCSGGAYESMLFGLPTAIVGEVPGSRTGICNTLDLQNPDFQETLQQTLFQGESPEIESRFNVLTGFLLKRYFYASGSSACPLVERSMGDALAEIIPN
jgi:hypothetical protein